MGRPGRLLRWIRHTSTLALVLLAAAGPGQAACGASASFSSIDQESGTYSYVYSFDNGGPYGYMGTSVSAGLQGVFWAIGHGNPSPGVGIDSGAAPVWSWIYVYPNYPVSILGDWNADPAIDGCIDDAGPDTCMGMLFVDQDPASGFGRYAFLTAARDPPAGLAFSFAQTNDARIELVPWSRPIILASQTRNTTTTRFTTTVERPTEAMYHDERCPSGNLLGYRLYQRLQTGGSRPPGGDLEGWSRVEHGHGDILPFDTPVTYDIACPRAGPIDLYLAATLVFESRFETPYLGPTATRITLFGVGGCRCGPDLDLDGSCTGEDCDDADDAILPGGLQVCGDGLNNDCDHPAWPALEGTNEIDDDGDGTSECGGDCDDLNATVFAGADEVCDGLANDCAAPAWPRPPAEDADLDGDGQPRCAGDCDDDDASTFLGAPQLCDGVNNDCAAPDWPEPPDDEADADGDAVRVCSGDCADDAATLFPGAPQLCDGLNNDCDDPAWPVVPPDETDADGDTVRICAGDCDDASPTIFPGAPETCNAVDDDCNDLVDDDAAGHDSDADSVFNVCDNCVEAFNPAQIDTDGDGFGNSCDNCTLVVNPAQADLDSDGRGDGCDNCVTEFNPLQDDLDGDTAGDACDNCFFDRNPSQSDADGDGEGDHCDPDDGWIYLLTDDRDYVQWNEERGYATWNLYRGDLRTLVDTGVYTQAPGSHPLAMRVCGLDVRYAVDGMLPAPGAVAFYLTTGFDGVESGLGSTGAEVPRPNDNPCP